MKTKLLITLVLAASLTSASAVNVSLFDWAISANGTYSEPLFGDPIPAGVVSGFDETTGLGSVTMTAGGVGTYYFGMVVDLEMESAFDDEIGSAVGTPGAGETWEIDDPATGGGFIFGDLFAEALLNTNFVGTLDTDIAMGLALEFSLLAHESAVATLTVGETVPTAGFYLEQFDTETGSSVYLSSNLSITGQPPSMPEGGFTLALLVMSVSGLALLRRHFRPCHQ